MGRHKPKKGLHTKKKGFKKSRDTKRRKRDVDQIYDDVARVEEKGPQVAEIDDDLPGAGQFYCIETGRHFTDQKSLDDHKKTKAYKKRCRRLKEESQYTQGEAEWAAGMTKEELPKLRGVMTDRGSARVVVIEQEGTLVMTKSPVETSSLTKREESFLGVSGLSSVSSFGQVLEAKQRELCSAYEELDGSGEKFCFDEWSRADGSRGVTRVIQNGDVIEKGGVSLTLAQGVLSEQRAAAMRARGRSVDAGSEYSAAALSLVLHAKSPFVPTFRSDVRLFVVGDDEWFGGGADLTPSYLFEEDAIEFHSVWKEVCEARSADYQKLKKWCDEYFYLPLREEHRGIGGIFFDEMKNDENFDARAFAEIVADTFVDSWAPIVERRRHMPYSDEHVYWQRLRRGRYLEFNLMHDRGVKFGLSPQALERVLVSAPPLVAWEYRHEPPPGSEEEKLLQVLKKPKDWLTTTE